MISKEVFSAVWKLVSREERYKEVYSGRGRHRVRPPPVGNPRRCSR